MLPDGDRRRRRVGGCPGGVLLVLAALAAAPTRGQAATTYYVRAGGDDANDGLAPTTAFASVRPAARRLREPGDRLIVGPGTYREGNIAPFGNGTPEEPIVLLGDRSGTATGDPPGPVEILPTNDPRATSGFYLRGMHDIVIDGFDIAGASDAGIEVRTRHRTGAESTRIALRNNRVRASRKGIQVTAVGDVEIRGNHLLGPGESSPPTAGDGLLLFGTPNAPMRPTVTGNVIEDVFIGFTGSRLADGVITDNQIRSRARNLQLRGNESLTVTGNRFRGPFRGGELQAVALSLLDNAFDVGVSLESTGELEVRRNTLRRVGVGGGPAHAVIEDNTLVELFIGGGGHADVARNEGDAFVTKRGLAAVTAVDNHFRERMKIRVRDRAELRNNEAGAMTAHAADALVHDNRVTGNVRVAADTAEVAGNAAAALTVQRLQLAGVPPAEDTAFAIRDNAVAGELVGVGAATLQIGDNTAGGLLRAIARQVIEVVDNEARGIACTAKEPGARVTLRGNRSRQSVGAGLSVIGAEEATVEDNVASDNGDSGLVLRRTARVVATGNELLSNRVGGISLRVPPAADCNEDVEVSISDLVTTICVALQRRPLHDCDAADTNRDKAVTVDEVVLGVGAALGRPDPILSSVVLRDNRVEHNQRFGVDVYARAAVVATGNRVLHNGQVPLAVHGLGPLGEATIAGNVLALGAAEGLFVEDVDTLRVRDNLVFGNRDAGMLLRATSGAVVANNLVYANGGRGIAVGVGDPRPTTDVVLANNTIFGNGNWGIEVGSGDVASTGTVVRDNILRQNVAGGIAAAPGALAGLGIGFNINTDGYGPGVPAGGTDLDLDPQLVAPAGADGLLGGDGFADDDFHLQPGSPAIDAGSATAAALGITGSAVAGQTTDEGVVDLGYHYGATPP